MTKQCANPECPRTGGLFEAKRSDAKTCSGSCRKAVSRNDPRPKEERRQAQLEGLNQKYVYRQQGQARTELQKLGLVPTAWHKGSPQFGNTRRYDWRSRSKAIFWLPSDGWRRGEPMLACGLARPLYLRQIDVTEYLESVRRVGFAVRDAQHSPLARLAAKLGTDLSYFGWGLLWIGTIDPIIYGRLQPDVPEHVRQQTELELGRAIRWFLAPDYADLSAATLLNWRKASQMLPAVATDTQLSQTVATLETCRDVIDDCVELIRSRFPDDERVQAAVEKLIDDARRG